MVQGSILRRMLLGLALRELSGRAHADDEAPRRLPFVHGNFLRAEFGSPVAALEDQDGDARPEVCASCRGFDGAPRRSQNAANADLVTGQRQLQLHASIR